MGLFNFVDSDEAMDKLERFLNICNKYWKALVVLLVIGMLGVGAYWYVTEHNYHEHTEKHVH